MLKKAENIKVDLKYLKWKKIAIVRSLFNGYLTKSLEEHCMQTLKDAGISQNQISTYEVPGALEIPVACSLILANKEPDVIVALGVVIKGDSYHFELVSNECARGCMEVSLKYNKPIIFEVISAYNLKDAQKRASNGPNNKGREGALAALQMLEFLSKKS